MAQNISLTSGSILNGNPITFAVMPNSMSNVSMHRIILEIECGMSSDDKYEVIKLSSPVVTEGKAQTIDISSALRTFRDSYEYGPYPTSYPLVKFNILAYDEYMSDGVVRKEGKIFWPQNPETLPTEERDKAYVRTIFGAFTDAERIDAGATKEVQTLSRKPASPQMIKVGETFAYTPPYSTPQSLADTSNLESPQSKVVNVTKEGAQTLGYQSVFALPANHPQERMQIRFINGFGVLESVSVIKSTSQEVNITAEHHVVARQQTFNQFSHGIVKKVNDYETWKFSTGPLDEAWMRWYVHEFLMAEDMWLFVPSSQKSNEGKWMRVHLVPEETTTINNTITQEIIALQFSLQFDINGSPIL